MERLYLLLTVGWEHTESFFHLSIFDDSVELSIDDFSILLKKFDVLLEGRRLDDLDEIKEGRRKMQNSGHKKSFTCTCWYGYATTRQRGFWLGSSKWICESSILNNGLIESYLFVKIVVWHNVIESKKFYNNRS